MNINQEAVKKELQDFVNIEEKISIAERLLQEKYHENFTAMKYKGREILQNYFTVEAYAENFPDILFRAYVDADEMKLSDEYVARRISDRISRKLLQNMTGLTGIYYIITVPMDSLFLTDDPEYPIENLADIDFGNRYRIHFFGITENDTIKEIFQNFSSMFRGLEFMQGYIECYFVDEKTMEIVQEYQETHSALYYDFHKLTEKNHIGRIHYVNGKPEISEEEFARMAGVER